MTNIIIISDKVPTPPSHLVLAGRDPSEWTPGTGTGCNMTELEADWTCNSRLLFESWLGKEQVFQASQWPKWPGLNAHTTFNQVVTWLYLVVKDWKYHPLTLLLCLRILLLFFGRVNVSPKQAQLVATAALLIASKVHQILHETLKEHAKICDNA